jgi:hypothetical protein
MSRVQNAAKDIAISKEESVNIGYRDRMLRDSARLSEQGRVVLTKINGRYYLALPNDERVSTLIQLKRKDIPEYKMHESYRNLKKEFNKAHPIRAEYDKKLKALEYKLGGLRNDSFSSAREDLINKYKDSVLEEKERVGDESGKYDRLYSSNQSITYFRD